MQNTQNELDKLSTSAQWACDRPTCCCIRCTHKNESRSGARSGQHHVGVEKLQKATLFCGERVMREMRFFNGHLRSCLRHLPYAAVSVAPLQDRRHKIVMSAAQSAREHNATPVGGKPDFETGMDSVRKVVMCCCRSEKGGTRRCICQVRKAKLGAVSPRPCSRLHSVQIDLAWSTEILQKWYWLRASMSPGGGNAFPTAHVTESTRPPIFQPLYG